MEVNKTTKVFSFKQEPFCYEKEDKNTKTGAETAQEKTKKKTFWKKFDVYPGKWSIFREKQNI